MRITEKKGKRAMSIPLSINTGDILFYEGNGPIDGIISAVTHSPYVHCSIALSSTAMVSALVTGIAVQPMKPPAKVWSYSNYAVTDAVSSLIAAIKWLRVQVGRDYAFKDIVLQGIHMVLPGVHIPGRGEYDCSELATRFLMQTGDVDMGMLKRYPNEVTPGALHNYLFSLPLQR